MQQFHATPYNISSKMSTTENNKVALGGQTSTTSYNISENERNVVSYNICLVKKFDRDQTSYNKIQHDKHTIQQGGQTSATFHKTSKLYDVV